MFTSVGMPHRFNPSYSRVCKKLFSSILDFSNIIVHTKYIDLLKLGVLLFMQDLFCRDLFCLLIFRNFPMFLVIFISLPGPGGQEVLLVTVPEFSHTQTACLVNLRTLSCESVSFSAFSANDDERQVNISH